MQGAGKAHSRSKSQMPPSGHKRNGIPTTGNEASKALLADWSPYWQQRRQQLSDKWWAAADEEQLPPITLTELDEALGSFKHKLGLSVSGGHPRSWLALPSEFKLCRIDMMHCWEACPKLAQEILTLMIFLGKPDGGLRPIGLIEAVLKVWSKNRRRLSKQWEAEHDLPAFGGMSGKPADRAGWVHNLLQGFALSRGWDTATLGTDLQNVYETVDHDMLMVEAKETRYPLKLMRAMVVLYGGPRAVQFDGACSEAFCTLSTIVVGCANATTAAKVLFYRMLKRMLA